MGKPRICVLPPLSLLTTKELKIFQYRWKFLRLAGFESHPLRYLSSTTTLPKDPKSTRLNSSHGYISYAVFCLKKNNVILTSIKIIISKFYSSPHLAESHVLVQMVSIFCPLLYFVHKLSFVVHVVTYPLFTRH